MTNAAQERVVALDMARGIAVGLMFVYHFSWDLTYFGFADLPLFTDPLWLGFRYLILSIFLLAVGFSQILVRRRGFNRRSFARRLALIAAAAAAVTAGSYLIFPMAYIFFGVLHNIVVSSVLVLAFVGLPVAVITAAAVIALAAPVFLAMPLFDHPWLQWVGLSTVTPAAVDYVPLLPWFGVALAGAVLGRMTVAGEAMAPALLWRPAGVCADIVKWAGRHSLILYLLHQPAFIAILYGVTVLFGPAP